MKRLGGGLDNVAYLVDDLVVRFRRADPGEVSREARVLRAVGAVSPIAVPVPEFVDPVGGCLAYRLLPGEPLLSAAERDGAAVAEPDAAAPAGRLGGLLAALHTMPGEADVLGGRLGGLLAALHAMPGQAGVLGGRLGGLLAALHPLPAEPELFGEIDDTPPGVWLDEALSLWPTVEGEVPPARREAVREFLGAAAPEPAESLAFSHQDLGAEHVLVDPGTWEITGIVDWSDAAVGDPARDLGLILRDLGPAAFAAAAEHVAPDLRDPRIAERARFYARCGLIADLAYGVSTAQPAYRDKSIAGLAWLFAPSQRE